MIGELAPIIDMFGSVGCSGREAVEGKHGTLGCFRGCSMGKVANGILYPWKWERHLKDIPVPSIRRQCHMEGWDLLCFPSVASGVVRRHGV